jgi:hypothetical protein
MSGIERMPVERAEPGREIALVHRREPLIGKKEHEPIVERFANRRDLLVSEGLRQIDAAGDRTDRWGQAGELQPRRYHGSLLLGT